VTNPPAMLQQVRGLEMLALRLRASLTAKKSTHSLISGEDAFRLNLISEGEQ